MNPKIHKKTQSSILSFPESSQQHVAQLTQKAMIVQQRREDLLRTQNDSCKAETTKKLVDKGTSMQKSKENYNQRDHYQSNRTLQPYLINIREEYVCCSGQNSITNKKEKEKQQHPPVDPLDNTSIQLSESRQVSEQMLLKNSVTSKFLSSPSLSLGLVQSKITHKETQSECHTKVLKTKQKKQAQFQNLAQQIVLLANSNPQLERKQPLSIYQQQEISITTTKGQQCLNKASEVSKKQNQQVVDSQIILNQNTQQNEQQMTLQINPILTLQFQNQILTSYQMQVQYLRKVNLMQSVQIQKLRHLLRIKQKQDACQQHPTQQAQITLVTLNNNKTKTFNKKAIDILNGRPNMARTKQITSSSALKERDLNINQRNSHKTFTNDTSSVQFICGNNSECSFMRKSGLLSTNTKFVTADTFCSLSNNNKAKNCLFRKDISGKKGIVNKGLGGKHHEKGHNFSVNTFKDRATVSMEHQGNPNPHNASSCSTQVMASKKTKKKTLKQRQSKPSKNISLVTNSRSSNKQNTQPKHLTQMHKLKTKTKQNSFMNSSIEMFSNTKKHNEHFLSVKKGERDGNLLKRQDY